MFYFFKLGLSPSSILRESDYDKEYGDSIHLTDWILFRKGEGDKCSKDSVKNNGQLKMQQLGIPYLVFSC